MNHQQLLKQDLSFVRILRVYGKQFRQIKKSYSDGSDGKCAIGVVMSYFGWDDNFRSDASESLQTTLHALRDVGINGGKVIELNDSGKTFEEIADYTDQNQTIHG